MTILLRKFICSFLFFSLALNAAAQTATEIPDSNSAAILPSAEAPSSDTAPVTPSAAAPSKTSADPWQRYNRSMFNFNLKVDRYFLKPIAKAYVRLTPGFFRQGVTNVFSNILEVPSAVNGVFQGKFSHAAHNSGRLLINTTLGVAGLFDVAKHMGLQGRDGEDFGQTLAIWGVKQGPYVVLPLLGSSTLRDSVALPIDWYTDPKAYIDHVPTSNTVRGVSVVSVRAGFLPLEKNITGDKYVFLRDVYLQRRNFLINDGVVEDSFGFEEEGGDY
ncbi:MAG: VacJ family lipoprotein [Pseudomonadota bacterium]